MKRWKKVNFGFLVLLIILVTVLTYHFITAQLFERDKRQLGNRLTTYVELELNSLTLSAADLHRLAEEPSPEIMTQIAEEHWQALRHELVPFYPSDGKALQFRKFAYMQTFQYYLKNKLYFNAFLSNQISDTQMQLNLLNKASVTLLGNSRFDLTRDGKANGNQSISIQFNSQLIKENGEWKFEKNNLMLLLDRMGEYEYGY